MNKQEAARLLAVVQARYPNANLGAAGVAAASWEMTLDDVPYELAEAELRAWFKAERFPPDPAEIRSRAARRGLGLPSGDDAWTLVLDVVRGKRQAESLPLPARRAVKSLGGWFNLRQSEQPGKDRAAFLKAYEQECRKDEDGALAALAGGAAIEPGLRSIPGGRTA